jgi:hypothetical protein
MPATKAKKTEPEAKEPEEKEDVGKSQHLSTTDANGKAIPQFALVYWHRADEVKEMISHLDDISRALRIFQKQEDLMYGEVNISGALADIQRVWTNLACAVPYSVCTQCQGQPQAQPKSECRMCKGRGLISKFRWDTVVPAEIKRLAKK